MPNGATITKWLGITVMLCGSVWKGFSPIPKERDPAMAAALFGGAMTAAGLSRKLTVIGETQAAIKSDTTALIETPVAPAAPSDS